MRETCEFASCVAAERFGVPLAQVGIHLDARTDADPQLLAIAGPALRALGLDDVDAVGRTPVVTCSAFGDVPERMHRFRASNGIPPSHPRDLVYVSFGSEAPESHHFPSLYRDAIEALADFPVLLTIGDRRDPAELGPLPRRVRVERWVAQDEVMPRAAADGRSRRVGLDADRARRRRAARARAAVRRRPGERPPRRRRRRRRSWSTTRPNSRTPYASCSTSRATSTPRAGSQTRSARCRQ